MSDVSGAGAVTPDWYPDPEHPDQLRYWDGEMWTDHRAPAVTGLSSIGDWFTAAFSTFGKCWKDLAILFALLVLPFAILTPIALVWAIDGIALEGISGLEVENVLGQPQIDATNVDPDNFDLVGFEAARFVPAALMGLVGLLAALVHGNAVRHRAFWANRNIPTTWQRSLTVGLKRAPRKFVWAIVFFLVIMAIVAIPIFIIAAAGAAAGGVAAVFVGLVVGLAAVVAMVFVWVRISMTWTSIAVGRGNPIAASARATKGMFWPMFGRLLLWALLAAIAGSIIGAPGQFAGAAFDLTQLDGVDRFELIDLFGGSVLSIGALVIFLSQAIARSTTGGFTAAAEGVLYHQLSGSADEAP